MRILKLLLRGKSLAIATKYQQNAVNAEWQCQILEVLQLHQAL